MKLLQCAKRASEIEYAIRDVVIPAIELEKKGHTILKLNIGDPNAYDWDTPEHIKQACKDAIDRGVNGYTPAYGVPELVKAISDDEKGRGADISPDDVVVTTGATEALQMIFGSCLEAGDEVLVPGPTYPPYITYTRFSGGNPIAYRTVEEEGWQPDLDDLRSKITSRTRAICLINPNNPTGAIYSEKTVKAITDIAGEYKDLFLISDEIYNKMTFEGLPKGPASLSPDIPTIVLNGISKNYLAPGWRIGYMGFNDPQGLMEDLKEGILNLARSRLCANAPAQYGYLAALTGPQDHLKSTADRLRKRRDVAAKIINESDHLSCVVPDGAFYMFPKIEHPAGNDDKKLVLDILHKKHVLTVHGSGFSPEYGKGHFRMVYLPPEDVIQDALTRVDQYLGDLGN